MQRSTILNATRLAPSPTGALHLGNARTFLVNWLLARQEGWPIILRIEDLDGPRIRRGADAQAMVDLKWLGIDWDQGPIYQSARHQEYESAIERLLAAGDAYYCTCTRREVETAASAPHVEDGASVYPGACRGRFATVEEAIRQSGRAPAIRFRVPDITVACEDQFQGRRQWNVLRQLGDFVIARVKQTARGLIRSAAYQLAVVVDDAAMGVDHVVRGDDLADSTPRQMLLYRALGLADRVPRYIHLPLVVGPDGRRLSKRHGDTRLASYREAGVPAARVLARLGRWCGIESPSSPQSAQDLIEGFSLARLAREPIVYDPRDDRDLPQPSI